MPLLNWKTSPIENPILAMQQGTLTRAAVLQRGESEAKQSDWDDDLKLYTTGSMDEDIDFADL